MALKTMGPRHGAVMVTVLTSGVSGVRMTWHLLQVLSVQTALPKAVSTSSEARHSMALCGHHEVKVIIPGEGRQGPLLVRGEAAFKPSPAPALVSFLNP